MTNPHSPSIKGSDPHSSESPFIPDVSDGQKYIERNFRGDLLTPDISAEISRLFKLRHPCLILPRKFTASGTLLFKNTPCQPFSNSLTALGKLKVLFAVAEGLRFLHEHNILHQIGHDSIVVGEEEEFFVVNPGALRWLLGSDERSTQPGSKESDVLAFGLFTSEILANERSAPAPFADLIQNCRDPNPVKRPTFESIVRQFLAGEFSLPDVDMTEFQNYLRRKVSGEYAAGLLIETLTRARLPSVGEAHEALAINVPTKHEGLITQLTREYCGNVHELGIVRIDGNHYDDEEKAKIGGILKHGWRSHWESKNQPNSWIQFDFTGTRKKLKLWKYEIQTWNSDLGHLSQWTLEVSSDGRDWVELDRRAGVTQLNRPSTRCCFKCKPHDWTYSFVRITQTGKNSSGMDILNLSGVEFYGELE